MASYKYYPARFVALFSLQITICDVPHKFGSIILSCRVGSKKRGQDIIYIYMYVWFLHLCVWQTFTAAVKSNVIVFLMEYKHVKLNTLNAAYSKYKENNKKLKLNTKYSYRIGSLLM